MVRYSYNQQYSPPAPFVHVTLGCLESGREIADLPAQIDVAADRTVITEKMVEHLQLVPLDEVHVEGFGGQLFLVKTYCVELTIRSSQRKTVEVIAHAEEPFVLLGRDILNDFRIILDGPRLFLEIEDTKDSSSGGEQ